MAGIVGISVASLAPSRSCVASIIDILPHACVAIINVLSPCRRCSVSSPRFCRTRRKGFSDEVECFRRCCHDEYPLYRQNGDVTTNKLSITYVKPSLLQNAMSSSTALWRAGQRTRIRWCVHHSGTRQFAQGASPEGVRSFRSETRRTEALVKGGEEFRVSRCCQGDRRLCRLSNAERESMSQDGGVCRRGIRHCNRANRWQNALQDSRSGCTV